MEDGEFRSFSSATSSTPSRPSAEYVRDGTYSDGTRVGCGSAFEKSWEMRNNGAEAWTGVQLIQVGGADVSAPLSVPIPRVEPGTVAMVQVSLIAPRKPGRLSAYFRLTTRHGERFGPRLWTDLNFVEGMESVPASVPAPGIPVAEHHIDSNSLPTAACVSPVRVAGYECVATPASAIPVSAPVPRTATPVVAKWSREMATIRDMGFTGDEEVLMSLLDLHNGDVAMVKMYF